MIQSFLSDNSPTILEPLVYREDQQIFSYSFTNKRRVSWSALPSNILAIEQAFCQNTPLTSGLHESLYTVASRSFEMTALLFAFVERLNTEMRRIEATSAEWKTENPPSRYIADSTLINAFAPLQMILQVNDISSSDKFLNEIVHTLTHTRDQCFSVEITKEFMQYLCHPTLQGYLLMLILELG